MKILLIISLFLSCIAAKGQEQIIVTKTLPVNAGNKYTGYMRMLKADSTDAEIKPGSVYFNSSAQTVVKIYPDWEDERKFQIWALKPGTSKIEVKSTNTDGKVLTKTFTITVTADPKKQGVKYILEIY